MLRAAVIAALALLIAAPAAEAHNVGWSIHKALCKVKVKKCVDPAPRPGPQTKCTASRVGDIEVIWDARLGAYVEWQCTSDGWRRVRIVPAQSLPWDPPQPRKVFDSHRACKAIVCKRVWVTTRVPGPVGLGEIRLSKP